MSPKQTVINILLHSVQIQETRACWGNLQIPEIPKRYFFFMTLQPGDNFLYPYFHRKAKPANNKAGSASLTRVKGQLDITQKIIGTIGTSLAVRYTWKQGVR